MSKKKLDDGISNEITTVRPSFEICVSATRFASPANSIGEMFDGYFRKINLRWTETEMDRDRDGYQILFINSSVESLRKALEFERKWRLKFTVTFLLGIVAGILLSNRLSFGSFCLTFAASWVPLFVRTLLETTLDGEDLKSGLVQCLPVLGGFMAGGIIPVIVENSLQMTTTRVPRIAVSVILSIVLAAYDLFDYRWYQTNLLQLPPISKQRILVICFIVSCAVGIPTYFLDIAD